MSLFSVFLNERIASTDYKRVLTRRCFRNYATYIGIQIFVDQHWHDRVINHRKLSCARVNETEVFPRGPLSRRQYGHVAPSTRSREIGPIRTGGCVATVFRKTVYGGTWKPGGGGTVSEKSCTINNLEVTFLTGKKWYRRMLNVTSNTYLGQQYSVACTNIRIIEHYRNDEVGRIILFDENIFD